MEIKIFNNSVEEFIQSLEKQTIAKVIHVIDLLEKFGNELGMPHSKKIFEKFFELRISGKQNIRIIYTYNDNKIILFLIYLVSLLRASSRKMIYHTLYGKPHFQISQQDFTHLPSGLPSQIP